ncbi:PREDICTED: syntaxin-8 [Ceratosolen solmsi marchali]|uniref:Syntaxin-8 n=1 Tax=Ceratosolen solmsi marchali TaxID=326594 RepID=A0AAJ6YV43_9HYME|nr:PREDICTED: syntaxin-8 [Ceratosolen solmsi marchali]
MALIYIDGSDPWLIEYETCDNLFREIMELLTLRDQEPKTSQTFANLSANIRMRLKQYNNQVQELKSKVIEANRQHTITAEEAERRTRQIEQLQSKDIQLQQLYESKTKEMALWRSQLLELTSSSVFADGGSTSWGIDDDEVDQPNTGNVNVADLEHQNQQLLEQQEEGLEQLSKIISRQKQIARTIHNEVDNHNEIIEDLADHMDKMDQHLINETHTVRVIGQKDKVWGYWLIIILLFISIIVCALV